MKIVRKVRASDFNFRMLSTNAGSPVQIKSNTSDKLLKLTGHCNKNPDKPVGMEKIYRLLYDPHLYEIAYDKLKSNLGNMTPDITPRTLDLPGLIELIISKMKDDSFKFSTSPALPGTPSAPLVGARKAGRREKISKASGGAIPLSSPLLKDRLVQEVMRMILEAIFEPLFSDNSHGFRSHRSYDTALIKVKEIFGVAT